MSTVITLLIVIFIFAFFMRWMDVMAKDRQGRMKLLEEAVKAGNLDEQAREDLVAAVSGRRPRRHHKPAAAAPASPHRATFLERLVLFIGWMAFLVGGALMIYGFSVPRGDDEAISGIIVGLCGFGLITYPFVVRELEGRKAPRITR